MDVDGLPPSVEQDFVCTVVGRTDVVAEEGREERGRTLRRRTTPTPVSESERTKFQVVVDCSTHGRPFTEMERPGTDGVDTLPLSLSRSEDPVGVPGYSDTTLRDPVPDRAVPVTSYLPLVGTRSVYEDHG